ncbi:MAG TPA: mechanosensitive ion channel domain-containing protein [Acidobacteriaceae bacterium]|nr:mechanosensitive ion channel domain-containing protein [Acidobacteriaceae bacterium]
MTKGRALLLGIPAALVVACLVGSYLTQGAMDNLAFMKRRNAGVQAGLVDQRPWLTVAQIAPLAVSAEERADALEAERLADHEVDQAFAMALRQAQMERRSLTGAALAAQQKLNGLNEQVKEDQAAVAALTAQLDAAKKRNAPEADAISDNLDQAKAQLQLDNDEQDDASDDLARASGDKRDEIQQELAAREESMKKYDAQLGGGEIATVSAKRYGTLARRIGGWFGQNNRKDLIEQAKAEIDADLTSLQQQHGTLDAQVNAMSAAIKTGAPADASGASAAAAAEPNTDSAAKVKIARMGQMHQLARIHSILEDRIATEQQLSAVYAKWLGQLELQHRIVRHLILQSMAGVAAIVLLGVLLWLGVLALLDRSKIDPRSRHTMRTIVSLAIQLLTLVLVLLAVFGAPSQMPTILGLGAAGLTVVFQDFILAFFGWFVLMGKNGIRVGDWVEINGVAGEVLEIGIFRTALLETGNWTDMGHPTGRRVTFINSFAVTGQFFNFSTAGQWMWDEITLNVPAGVDQQKTLAAIESVVGKETERDTKLAEAEWQSSSKAHGLSQFSAAPRVDLRPAASGIDVLVRYVTRAGERFEMRNKLYGAVIGVLHPREMAEK